MDTQVDVAAHLVENSPVVQQLGVDVVPEDLRAHGAEDLLELLLDPLELAVEGPHHRELYVVQGSLHLGLAELWGQLGQVLYAEPNPGAVPLQLDGPLLVAVGHPHAPLLALGAQLGHAELNELLQLQPGVQRVLEALLSPDVGVYGLLDLARSVEGHRLYYLLRLRDLLLAGLEALKQVLHVFVHLVLYPDHPAELNPRLGLILNVFYLTRLRFYHHTVIFKLDFKRTLGLFGLHVPLQVVDHRWVLQGLGQYFVDLDLPPVLLISAPKFEGGRVQHPLRQAAAPAPGQHGLVLAVGNVRPNHVRALLLEVPGHAAAFEAQEELAAGEEELLEAIQEGAAPQVAA